MVVINRIHQTKRWLWVTGVVFAALFFTVCAIDGSLWRGVVTGKYFHFAFAMCILVVWWFYRLCGNNPTRYTVRSADVAVFAFVGFMAAHQFFTDGISGDMHWQLFLLMIPLYVIFRSLPRQQNDIILLTDVILVFALTEALWGILQQYGCLRSYHKDFRITGSLFNPGPYAGFVSVCLPLAFHRVLNRSAFRLGRILGVAVLVASIFVLPAAESRAAWMAALAGCLFVLHTVFGKRIVARFSRGKRMAGAMALVALAVIFLYGAYRMKKDSADGRLLIWKVSVSLIKEKPLTGHGFERFPAAYREAQADWFAAGKGSEAETMIAGNPAYAFNEWVHIAVEQGLIGLALFVCFVVLCLISGRKKNRIDNDCGGFRAVLLAFCVFATFSYPLDVLPLTILFTVTTAVTASRTSPLCWRLSPGFVRCCGAVCLVIACALSFRILSGRLHYADWREAHALFLEGSYYDAAEEYEYLFDDLRHEKLFLMEYARCLAHTKQYEESNRIFAMYLTKGGNPETYNYMGSNYQMTGQYDLAEQAYLRSAQILPGRLTPRYMLMRLYLDTGQNERAAETAHILKEMPVKIPSAKAERIKQEAQETVNKSDVRSCKEISTTI